MPYKDVAENNIFFMEEKIYEAFKKKSKHYFR